MNETVLLKIKESLKLDKLAKVFFHGDKNKDKVLQLGYSFTDNGQSYRINLILEDIDSSEELVLALAIQNNLKDFQHNFHPLLITSIGYRQAKVPTNLIKEFESSLFAILSHPEFGEEKIVKLDKVNQKFAKKIEYYEAVNKEETQIDEFLKKLNIQEYHNYFSFARSVKRKLKLYIGPTNSGKTYHALNDLARHNSGTYLSPLRLLAWEGKEELEKRGHKTSLITGEEKHLEEGAKFSAQTIETLNFNQISDAILIDEIQMVYDLDRGWAWTQALIGAPCKELIMAGAPESEPLITKIAQLLGEELEIIRLERFNPLEVVAPINLENALHNLPEGSALIAFSRKNVLNYKQFLESKNKKVSVIYGNLSPEVRTEEARKFRDGETQYLVSTDAISMGLNLPISTIVFTTVEKFNGEEVVNLSPTEIKQIAGRAGRYGKVEKGSVTALNPMDVKYIKSLINAQDKTNNFLYIKPNEVHVSKISEQLETADLFRILNFFTSKVMTNQKQLYVCANLEQQKELALHIDKIKPLALSDKFLFANAPVPNEDHYSLYMNWIKKYSKGEEISLPKVGILKPSDYGHDQLLILETYVKILNLYAWLSFKKSESFPDHEACIITRQNCNKEIEQLLNSKKEKK